jgi:hypothetical protein
MKLTEVPRSEIDNFNTPDLEQAPDSYLKPGETLEDFDVEFRRPNAQGGVQQLVSNTVDGSRPGYSGKVLKDYLLNDLGYEKYDSTKIKVKFPNLLIEQDLKQGNVFKPLTKQQKTLIKESFDLPEGVKDWNFKKYKFGISSEEHMNLAKQMERRIGGGQKYTLAASFDKPQGWMMSAMERVYNNETVLKDGKRVLKEGVKKLTYDPIRKGNLIVGFKDNTVAGDGKTYYGTKKNLLKSLEMVQNGNRMEILKKLVNL